MCVFRQPQQLALEMEATFTKHGFPPQWRYGMYDYSHYHSTAHEVLGVYQGSARLQFGGDGGAAVQEEVAPGDVIVIPAGVAHRGLDMRGGFSMVGAYPEGAQWDMCTGKDEHERQRAERNIAAVPLPAADPVYGAEGPLLQHWRGD